MGVQGGGGCKGGSSYVLDVSWTVRFLEVNILAILVMVPAKPAVGDMGTQSLETVTASDTRHSHRRSSAHTVGRCTPTH